MFSDSCSSAGVKNALKWFGPKWDGGSRTRSRSMTSVSGCEATYFSTNVLVSVQELLMILTGGILSNFWGGFDAEWLVISGKYSPKGAKIHPAPRVCPILPVICGLFLAKATSLSCKRYLDPVQNGTNQNRQEFLDRHLDTARDADEIIFGLDWMFSSIGILSFPFRP